MATLQTYLTATQRLLHDANFKYWTQNTLVDAINGACKRVVGDSGCNRQLQTITLTGGREVYNYGGVTGVTITASGSGYVAAPIITFDASPTGDTATATATIDSAGAVSAVTITNHGSGYVSSPNLSFAVGAGTRAYGTCTALNANTLDTMNITAQWGTERIILNRMPFTQFQATVRSWMGYTQRPGWCASYGQNQWYIGPIPDINYNTEWDTIINPPDLVNVTDVSVIQYPFSECVAYYAAHTAKFQEQSFAESDKFLETYTRKMQYSRRSVMMRMLPSAYNG